MKFYLGGGWNPDKGEEALDAFYRCIEKIFKGEGIKQILHIPFARTGIMKKNRTNFLPHKFGPYIRKLGIQYLNAQYIEDIKKFSGDTIYINGGNDNEFLLKMCKEDILFSALQKAKIIIGESAGAMILGAYLRNNDENDWIQGLGYIENTLIEPHFTEINSQEILKKGIKKMQVQFGLGIDENTFVLYKNGIYGKIIGTGKIFHKENLL
ncbi:type 1 glutamine amidotransferase-like domain-containing protein [Candidatus Gracilibacteria bacterium]|nr:type 1 glutamine amidotransferase-like domain-containing protein [Candidatus Gracilibacteria bacterium]NUJ98904.1 type 1 glutamine amidotransferase-like domain-containing protein [Candidatus Gracilibacteria bacterium]